MSARRTVLIDILAVAGFVVVAVVVRGIAISNPEWLNPDEAELMVQGRAAMGSPVPFTSWTMGTTGPFWVQFLALLGWLGTPMTLAAAHLLAAVLLGAIGGMVFVPLRRTHGLHAAALLGLAWWLPVALIFPVGGAGDFGTLATELLPAAFVTAAGLVPASRLAAQPWLFLVMGVLGGLAIGSKYQVLPIVAGLFVARVIELRLPFGALIRAGLWWVAGIAVPVAAVVVAVLITPAVSPELRGTDLRIPRQLRGRGDAVRPHRQLRHPLVGRQVVSGRHGDHPRMARVAFRPAVEPRPCRARAERAPRGDRRGHGIRALPHPDVRRSRARDDAAGTCRPTRRAVPALGPHPHGRPGRGDRRRARRGRRGGPLATHDGCRPRGCARSALGPARCAACRPLPAGLRRARLGLGAKLYVYQDWQNTTPYLNSLGPTSNPANRDSAAPLLRRSILASDCVDAAGPPFFGFGTRTPFTQTYPEFAALLDSRFRAHTGVGGCDDCVVYVAD